MEIDNSEQTPVEPSQDTLTNNVTNQKGNVPIIIGVVLLLLIVGGGGYYLGTRQNPVPSQPSTTVPTATQTNPTSLPAASQVTNTTKNWKTYTIKAIGLEYKLPPALSKFGEMKEETIAGEKGNQLCITFPQKSAGFIRQVYAGGGHCPIVHFGFGTTSVDYEAGRSGGFTDLQGFKIENGKYYARFVDGKTFEIPSDIVKEFKTDSGMIILKVLGKKYEDGPSPFVYDGSIGALVNTNNPKYTGIAVQLELKEGFTEEEFDQILSTLKFIN